MSLQMYTLTLNSKGIQSCISSFPPLPSLLYQHTLKLLPHKYTQTPPLGSLSVRIMSHMANCVIISVRPCRRVCLQTVLPYECSAHEALTNNIHMSRFCEGEIHKVTFYWSYKPQECAHKGNGTVCVHP